MRAAVVRRRGGAGVSLPAGEPMRAWGVKTVADGAGGTGTPEARPEQLVVAEVEATIEERMRKKAVAGMRGHRRFVIYSDEGPHLGGDDSAPTPLTIFASGVAF